MEVASEEDEEASLAGYLASTRVTSAAAVVKELRSPAKRSLAPNGRSRSLTAVPAPVGMAVKGS